MVKVIIDTDTSLGTQNAEIDDGAALLVLLHDPEVEILGITTVHGNVPVRTATTNALRLVALAGYPEIPVYAGCGIPLVKDDDWLDFLRGWQANYGETPPWDASPQPLSAVDAIIAAVEANPNEITILALGPLTNLARAVRKAPHISALVKSVVAMGGSLIPSPQAEFNIRCDPEAAAAVFAVGWPLKLHGLEITRRCLFSRQDFEALDQSDPAAALLADQALAWIPVVESQGWETGGCSLHDAVAAAALINEDLFSYQTGFSVQVDLDYGPGRGVTRAVPQDAPTHLSLAAGIETQACKAFIQSRL